MGLVITSLSRRRIGVKSVTHDNDADAIIELSGDIGAFPACTRRKFSASRSTWYGTLGPFFWYLRLMKTKSSGRPGGVAGDVAPAAALPRAAASPSDVPAAASCGISLPAETASIGLIIICVRAITASGVFGIFGAPRLRMMIFGVFGVFSTRSSMIFGVFGVFGTRSSMIFWVFGVFGTRLSGRFLKFCAGDGAIIF